MLALSIFAWMYHDVSAWLKTRSYVWSGSTVYIRDRTENFTTRIDGTVDDYNANTSVALILDSTTGPYIDCNQTPGTGTAEYRELNLPVQFQWYAGTAVYHGGGEDCTDGVSCDTSFPDFEDTSQCNRTDKKGNIAWVTINGYKLRRQIGTLQQGTMTHEMGHVLGLGHEVGTILNGLWGIPCEPSVMFDQNCTDVQINQGLPVIYTLQPEDIDQLSDWYE